MKQKEYVRGSRSQEVGNDDFPLGQLEINLEMDLKR